MDVSGRKYWRPLSKRPRGHSWATRAALAIAAATGCRSSRSVNLRGWSETFASAWSTSRETPPGLLPEIGSTSPPRSGRWRDSPGAQGSGARLRGRLGRAGWCRDAGKIDGRFAGYLDGLLLGGRLGHGTDQTHVGLTSGWRFTGADVRASSIGQEPFALVPTQDELSAQKDPARGACPGSRHRTGLSGRGDPRAPLVSAVLVGGSC
jgi:hypothetical protein